MVNVIKTFSTDNDGVELAIVVIMSHGDESGDIYCQDGSICRVHNILRCFPGKMEQSRVLVYYDTFQSIRFVDT